MKILVLSDRFYPEIAAPSVRILDHARVWLEDGHEVTVVTCAPNFPRGVLFDGYRNRLYQEEWVEGIRVVRVWSYMTANEGFLKRTLDYVSFMLSATLLAFRYPAFDVVLATSPPLFTAVAGWLVSVLRRRPWVFEIRDLWPASIRAVGASDGAVLRFFERLELFLYRRADGIVSLTQSFKRDLCERGIPADKNRVVPNGVDVERFSPERVDVDVRAEFGVPDDVFLAGYVGTTGLAHGLETVVDAAAICRDRDDLRFLIMGEGAERGALEARARELGLSNLIFRDFAPHDRVPAYLAGLDASIVHLRPDPLFRTVIPSKIFEAMAMGTPIVMAVEGESADIVRDAGCGLCLPSGDARALADAVLKLAGDATLRKQLSAAGRRAASERYSRRAGARAVVEALDAARGAREPGRG